MLYTYTCSTSVFDLKLLVYKASSYDPQLLAIHSDHFVLERGLKLLVYAA